MGRNRLDFVAPGAKAGQVRSITPRQRKRAGFRDNPEGGEPLKFEVAVDVAEIGLQGHPFTYEVEVMQTADGPKVSGLRIESPGHDVPLEAEDLHKLARLLDRLAHAGHAAATGQALTLLGQGQFDAFAEPERVAPPKRPGGRGHPEEFYREVAELARQAHQDRARTGISAKEHIAKQYGVSPETVNTWLARARKRGYLRPGELGGTPRKKRTQGDSTH